MADSVGARMYELHLDRVRLRAIAARQRRDGQHSELEQTQVEIGRVDQALADVRASKGRDTREDRIAGLLDLSAHEIDLLWSAVAATMDPSLSPHLRELAGGEARHGISIALHAIMAGLDAGTARGLALQLTDVHPLLRYGLLQTTNDVVPASRLLSVPVRVARFLAGDDTIDPAILRAGGVIRIGEEPHFDPLQLGCIRQLAQALVAENPVLAIVEGPADVGKRTAAALAALSHSQSVIHIDATRLPASVADLERAFVALRRECLLNGALPLVAHVDVLAARDGQGDERLRCLAGLLDETPIPVVVTSTAPGIDLGTARGILRITMPVADTKARAVLWQRVLGESKNVDLDTRRSPDPC